MSGRRRRVAILGGGMAGLSAAWSLSEPECREEFEVTVYQRGWRLGGKGASSRGVHGRIEEHGLHVWLGYYDNAFRLLRDVYDELDRSTHDPGCPITTWRDAMQPADRVGVEDRVGDGWEHWVASFGRNDLEPGSASTPAGPMSAATFVRRGLRLLRDFAGSSRGQPTPLGASVVLSASARPPQPPSFAGFGVVLRQAEIAAMVGTVESLRLLRATIPSSSPLAVRLLDLLEQMRDDLVDRLQDTDDARRSWLLADLVIACLQGTISDDLLAGPGAFAAIDHLDFREWLARHGARPDTLDSALVRGMYDLVFAYEGGDVERPRFSAGLGLFLATKLFFDYKGAIFWKLQAGMGDVVFAPLYQALRARGVDFQFFHRVDRLRIDRENKAVHEVVLARQARLAGGRRAYEPLIRVKGIPCFPSAPLTAQLEDGAVPDLERAWADKSKEERMTLKLGEDFDDIVLATSVGILPDLCGELGADSSRWRRMMERVATVPTQALQVWLRRSERELGWPHAGATISGYVWPFDTYSSMSHVLPYEAWDDEQDPARAVGYFCSVLPTAAAADPEAARVRVGADARRFLDQGAKHFWPLATAADGTFRWDMLVGGGFEAQFHAANVDPSDRYVQSLPGTWRYRLRADESGYENLVLAGDWINCGLNAGCIEAAAMAGLQAANAMRGRPLMDGVLGSWCSLDVLPPEAA